MASASRSRVPSVLALLLTLPAVGVGVGLLLHTDFDPDVFGKYRWGYLAILLTWWIVVLPLLFVVLRWVFSTQPIRLPSGRVLTWRPSAKILLVLVVGSVFAYAVEYRIDKALGRGVATPLRSDAFHPYLQNAPVPYHRDFGTNRFGFRGTDLDRAKPQGQVRVFLLGGSTLFCAALPLEKTPGELLERRLRAARPALDVEVQNAAAEWHSSEHSLIKFLTQIQELGPDVLVIYHGINDLYRSFSPEPFAVGPYRNDYGHFHGAVAGLARPHATNWPLMRMQIGYCFSDLLYDRVRVRGPDGTGVRGVTQMFFPKAKEVEIESWPSLSAFERNLGDLVAAARREGIHVLLASQPSIYRADLTAEERQVVWFPCAHQQGGTRASPASMAEGMRRFNAVTRTVAETAAVAFHDLDAGVPKTTEYLYDDVHYTAKGAETVARELAEALLTAGYLPGP